MSTINAKKGKKPDWLKFDPKIDDHDKRHREDAVGDIEMTVLRNLNKYGIPSCGIAASVNIHREIHQIKYLVPEGSPLSEVFQRPEIRKQIEEAFILQQVWILEKMKNKLDSQDNVSNNDQLEVATMPEPEEPHVPIFSLSESQMRSYYPNLLRSLYQLENVTKYRLWPKKQENGELLEATKLKLYDQNAEKIIPRNGYGGPGKSGPKNLLWRQKCLSAYFLLKLGKNINTYCKEMPEDYIEKDYTIDSIIGVDKDKPENSDKTKSRFENRVDNILKKNKHRMNINSQMTQSIHDKDKTEKSNSEKESSEYQPSTNLQRIEKRQRTLSSIENTQPNKRPNHAQSSTQEIRSSDSFSDLDFSNITTSSIQTPMPRIDAIRQETTTHSNVLHDKTGTPNGTLNDSDDDSDDNSNDNNSDEIATLVNKRSNVLHDITGTPNCTLLDNIDDSLNNSNDDNNSEIATMVDESSEIPSLSPRNDYLGASLNLRLSDDEHDVDEEAITVQHDLHELSLPTAQIHAENDLENHHEPREQHLSEAQLNYEERVVAPQTNKATESRNIRKGTGKGGKHLTLAALRKRKPQNTYRKNIDNIQQLNEALISNITREGYEQRHGVGSIEATKERRRVWKSWKEKFIEDTKALASRCKSGETIQCPECNLDQHKGSFTRHRTEYCKSKSPKLLLKNWSLKDFMA